MGSEIMSQINHYVPQFILRRYGNKINKYNVKEGRFILKGSIQTAFSKKDIYPDELEEKFSKLESTFARLIDNKILKNNNEIILNRNEIWLIKKFFTVASLRVPASINGPKNLDTKEQYEQMGFKEVEINNETDLEYSYRTLNVILDANCIEDVYNSASVT